MIRFCSFSLAMLIDIDFWLDGLETGGLSKRFMNSWSETVGFGAGLGGTRKGGRGGGGVTNDGGGYWNVNCGKLLQKLEL